MKKGSHIPETKKSLNDTERLLLEYLTEPLDSGYSFAATSLDIDEMLKNTDLVKDKKWTHHSTTETLSNLVGMDLIEEITGFLEDEKVNNITPVYVIEYESTIHSRAIYARDRPNSTGISLFHLIRGDDEYGEGLWPNRPVDRIKLEAKISEDGTLNIMYSKKDFLDMANQTVTVIIQS